MWGLLGPFFPLVVRAVTHARTDSCSHPFCITCIRAWRTHKERTPLEITAGKTCPTCRRATGLVTPSLCVASAGRDSERELTRRVQHLLEGGDGEGRGHAGAQRYVRCYSTLSATEELTRCAEKLAATPCRHLLASPSARRWCPFGSDCVRSFPSLLSAFVTPFHAALRPHPPHGRALYLRPYARRHARHRSPAGGGSSNPRSDARSSARDLRDGSASIAAALRGHVGDASGCAMGGGGGGGGARGRLERR